MPGRLTSHVDVILDDVLCFGPIYNILLQGRGPNHILSLLWPTSSVVYTTPSFLIYHFNLVFYDLSPISDFDVKLVVS